MAFGVVNQKLEKNCEMGGCEEKAMWRATAIDLLTNEDYKVFVCDLHRRALMKEGRLKSASHVKYVLRG